MKKAEKQLIRDWAAHLGLRLRRHDSGYSLYATYTDRDGGFAKGDRLVTHLRTLEQVDQWLGKYSDYMIARLSRPGRRKRNFVQDLDFVQEAPPA
jgi:hypothetical protein